MYLKVAVNGPNVPTFPAVTFEITDTDNGHVNAAGNPFTGTSNVVHLTIDGGAAAQITRSRQTGTNIFLYTLKYEGIYNAGGLSWKVGFDNDAVERSYVWVTADNIQSGDATTNADLDQPWIDVRPSLLEPGFPLRLDFLTPAGSTGATNATLEVRNYGTGQLHISGITGLPPSFSTSISGTINVDTNDSTTITITNDAPATAVPPTNLVVACNDTGLSVVPPRPNDNDGHNQKLILSGGTFNYEVMLLLDASGSMPFRPDTDGNPATDPPNLFDKRWDKLLDATSQFSDMLMALAPTATRFGVAMFPDISQGVDATHPFPPANPLSAGTITAAGPLSQTVVDTLKTRLAITPGDPSPLRPAQYGGATPLGKGLEVVLGHPGVLTENPFFTAFDATKVNDRRYLVVMSDGKHNSPGVGESPKPEDFTLANTFQPRHVSCVGIAYGAEGSVFEVKRETLQNLATESTDATTGLEGIFLDATIPPTPTDPGNTRVDELTKTFRAALVKNLGLEANADPSGVLTDRDPSVTREIHVTEYDNRLAIVVEWATPDPARLHVEVISPNCECFTISARDEAGDGEGGELGKSHSSQIYRAHGKTYQMFAFDRAFLENRRNPSRPRFGAWTLRISLPGEYESAAKLRDGGDGEGGHRGRTEPYVWDAIVDSSLKMTLKTDKRKYFAGQPIQVSALLTLEGLGLPHASVTLASKVPLEFDHNFIANSLVSDDEYAAAAKQLAGADVTSVGIKAYALQQKNLTFAQFFDHGTLQMTDAGGKGVYTATLPAYSTPGTYHLYVACLGQTPEGEVFRREQKLDIHVAVQPVVSFTILDISYKQVIVDRVTFIDASVRVQPRDQFGNVLLIDPTVEADVSVIARGGRLVGGLADNHDGTYTQVVRYVPEQPPVIVVRAGDVDVVPAFPVPNVKGLVFCDTVQKYRPGAEATKGANKHTDANQALGSPLTRPEEQFVSLGGRGSLALGLHTGSISARDLTVFVHRDAPLRPYIVEVLASSCNQKWVKIGESSGVTQTFSLLPTPPDRDDHGHHGHHGHGGHGGHGGHHRGPDCFDAWIDHRGHIAGDARLSQCLDRLGLRGIKGVRITDTSGEVLGADGKASASPGVSIRAVGFSRG
jgi:hypothetical protein